MRKPKSSASIPRPGEGKRGEQGYLGYLLRQASGAYRLRMDRIMSDLGVTHPQFSVLTMLDAYPGLSNADLARLSVLTPQTVSVIVTNLERMGAITRRPHAVHGRIQHIDVTDSGRLLLAECKERILAVEKRLRSGLSAEEERTIRRWLVRLAVEDDGGNRSS